jgi:hypothetical protein
VIRGFGRRLIAVFEQRVAEVDVRHRFVRVFDDRFGVERARDGALAVHVQQRPEIRQRAEVCRFPREHVRVRAFGLLVTREILQTARARKAQGYVIGMLFDERVDADERFLVGEGLSADAHRHRNAARRRLERAGGCRVHRLVIGAKRRRDYASSERAPVNVNNGSRSPEKNAIMSLTIARALSSVRW